MLDPDQILLGRPGVSPGWSGSRVGGYPDHDPSVPILNLIYCFHGVTGSQPEF